MAIISPETPLKGAALDAMLADIDEGDPNLIWTLMKNNVGDTALAETVETAPVAEQDDIPTDEEIPVNGSDARARFLISFPPEEPPAHEVIQSDYIRAQSSDVDGRRLKRLRGTVRSLLTTRRLPSQVIDATEHIVSELGGNFVRHVLGYHDEWSSADSATPAPKEAASPEKFGRLDICKVQGTGELLVICHATTSLSPEEIVRETELRTLDARTSSDAKIEPFLNPDQEEHGLGTTIIKEFSRKEHGVGRFEEDGTPPGAYSLWAVVRDSDVTLAV